jgi:hypothetical protein
MLIFESQLIEPATKAKMKVPPDTENFKLSNYPHFKVFCCTQLQRHMVWGEQWENAKVIMKFSESEIQTISLHDLIEAGYSYPD